MKKIFLIAALAAGLTACNNDSTSSGADRSDSSDNAAASPSAYRASDGDVSYRNGRLMVWKDNDWVESDQDVTLEDGVVVRRDGKVVRNNQERDLEDGEVVTRAGRFFDKAGNAIENAWQDVKQGAKDAKDEVKDALKDNDKKDQ